VVAALAVGFGVAVWQAIEADRARGVATVEAWNANQQTIVANQKAIEADIARGVAADEARKKTEALAQRDVEARNAEDTTDFFRDVLTQASPAEQAAAGRQVDPNLPVKAALDYACAHLAVRYKNQPLREARLRHAAGVVYYQLKQLPKAAEQLEVALAIRRRELSPRDPDLLSTVNSLGEVYRLRRWRIAALLLLREALAGYLAREAAEPDRVTQDDRRHRLKCQNNLAVFYQELKHPEAERFLKEALDGRTRILGPDDPDTLRSVHNLARFYFYYGRSRYADAEPLFQRALAGRLKVSDQHPETISTIFQLAELYWWWNKPELAEPLYRKAVALGDVVERDAWTTATYHVRLGQLLRDQKKFLEAEQHLLTGYERLKAAEKDLPAGSKWVSEAAQAVFELYVKWGQIDKAQIEKARAWRKEKAADLPKPAKP
jgi:tetratricopeptide (TPR) repeat protein